MKIFLSYLGIATGSFIFGFGLNYFIIANGLAEGGITGLALIIHYFTAWPVGSVNLILNIPLLLVCWKRWGRLFVTKTLLGVAGVSLAVDLTRSVGLQTHDLLLGALYGGVFSGIGIGIVIRSGATTGGADIIARFIHEQMGISMGKVYLAIDFFVLSLVAFFFGLEKSLYTLVAVYVFSEVVDKVVQGFNTAKAVMIISSAVPLITHTLIRELDRSATVLKGYGAYTGREKDVLYVVVGMHQLLQLKKIVRNYDPQAFVIVNDAYEVLGEGFRRPI